MHREADLIVTIDQGDSNGVVGDAFSIHLHEGNKKAYEARL